MTERQILKKLDKALELFARRDYKEGLKVLMELRTRLEMEIKEKEEDKDAGKRIQHLVGWYMKLWNDRPPESLRFVDFKSIVAKHLKELLQIYERNGEDIESLKKDYEAFKQSRRDWNGILQFRQQLPNLKNAKGNEWSSPENQRGKDYYLQGWGEEEKPFSSEDDEFPW